MNLKQNARSLIFGKGINDSDYNTQVCKGKSVVWRCPIYDRWTNMLRRCYSQRYHESFPTYIGCEVCEEWLTFSNFRIWMTNQTWQDKDLDKDLLGNGKLYSPETCVFVDKEVNYTLTVKSNLGDLPIGVSVSHNKYQVIPYYRARIGDKWLGHFKDKTTAHKRWQEGKIEILTHLYLKQTDKKTAEAILVIRDKIIADIQHNRETLSITNKI